MYDRVFSAGKSILEGIYEVLGIAEISETQKGHIAVVNTLPWERKEILDLPSGEIVVASGTGVLSNVSPFRATEGQVSVKQVDEDIFVMENSQLRVKISSGVITSLYDYRANRETISRGGKANQFVIFDDKPLYWQAWDVEVFHLHSRQELSNSSTKIIENSAHRVSILTETKISSNSWIKTTITLAAAFEDSASSVVIQSEIEWQETMKFLKVEFPVNIRNTEASYETQYGIIRRPTHYNTT